MPEIEARLAHVLPLRVRLEVPALAGQTSAAGALAERLLRQPSVERVAVRVGTGSVVVESDEHPLDAESLLAETRSALGELRDDQERPLRKPQPTQYPGPTPVARALAHAFAGINGDVRRAFGGHADLGTILPVVFAVAGIAEVAVTRRLPVPAWFNLMWWSLRSFMTFNERAVHEETRANRTATLNARRARRASRTERDRSRRRASGP